MPNDTSRFQRLLRCDAPRSATPNSGMVATPGRRYEVPAKPTTFADERRAVAATVGALTPSGRSAQRSSPAMHHHHQNVSVISVTAASAAAAAPRTPFSRNRSGLVVAAG